MKMKEIKRNITEFIVYYWLRKCAPYLTMLYQIKVQQCSTITIIYKCNIKLNIYCPIIYYTTVLKNKISEYTEKVLKYLGMIEYITMPKNI